MRRWDARPLKGRDACCFLLEPITCKLCWFLKAFDILIDNWHLGKFLIVLIFFVTKTGGLKRYIGR